MVNWDDRELDLEDDVSDDKEQEVCQQCKKYPLRELIFCPDCERYLCEDCFGNGFQDGFCEKCLREELHRQEVKDKEVEDFFKEKESGEEAEI